MFSETNPTTQMASRRLRVFNPRSGGSRDHRRIRAVTVCLGLILIVFSGAGLVSCATSDDTFLSAEEIQATVNAIVTASASPPSQIDSPAPFHITPLTGSGWGIDGIRIDVSQGAFEDVQWSERSNLVIQSSVGIYELDPTRWGSWTEAWSSNASNNQTIIPSPDGSHHILIENHMWIIRKFDGNPIGLIGDVPETVKWTSDGAAVVFAITNQEAELDPGLYAWPVESPNPRIVLQEQSNLGSMYISPSGTRAAYLINTETATDLTLRLVDLPSGEAETRRINLSPGWQLADWVSDDLIKLSMGHTSPSYTWYNVETQTLYPVQDGEAEINPVPPLPSPDGHWVAGDSVQIISNQTGELTTNEVEHVYFVADLATDDNHNIAYGPDSMIEYLTWSPDSQKLFLVNCPLRDNAQAAASAPYGLLAYEPATNTSEVLFGKALEVALSPSQQWAYVVFPSLDASDERVLSGALWEVGSQTLLHRRFLLDDFVYRSPVTDDASRPTNYIYARWSHDGQHLVVVDPGGSLRLYDLEGQVEVLQHNIFEDGADWITAMNELHDGGIYWSPNDHFLVVNYRGLYLLRLD
jgi:hypothetical protein